jgi:hypothetical protein
MRAMPQPLRVAAHAQIPIPASWIGNGSTDGAGVVRLVTPYIVVSHPAWYPARHGIPHDTACLASEHRCGIIVRFDHSGTRSG